MKVDFFPLFNLPYSLSFIFRKMFAVLCPYPHGHAFLSSNNFVHVSQTPLQDSYALENSCLSFLSCHTVACYWVTSCWHEPVLIRHFVQTWAVRPFSFRNSTWTYTYLPSSFPYLCYRSVIEKWGSSTLTQAGDTSGKDTQAQVWQRGICFALNHLYSVSSNSKMLETIFKIK